MLDHKLNIFAIFNLCLISFGLCQSNPCKISTNIVDSLKIRRFTCDSNTDEPFIPNEYLIDPSQYDMLDFSQNSFTSIQTSLLCKFNKTTELNLSYNKIKSIENKLNELKCMPNLAKIVLSHNQIESWLYKTDDDFGANLEHLDLSYNSIYNLDTSLFIKNKNQPRFPKLKYFKISNNKLIDFDLLIPLSLPSASLYFDASSNPIRSFKNQLKKSFRENPFYFDVNSAQRNVYLNDNRLEKFGQDLLYEYGIKSSHDMEIFLTRIPNYLLVGQTNDFVCKCPIIGENPADFIKEIKNLNQSSVLYQLTCSNFIANTSNLVSVEQKPFALNYSCEVLKMFFCYETFQTHLNLNLNLFELKEQNQMNIGIFLNKLYNSLKTLFNNLYTFLLNYVPGVDVLKEKSQLNEFERNSILSDLGISQPKKVLKIFWPEYKVDLGNTLSPTQVVNKPNIEWPDEKNSYFSLIFIDPDASSRWNPTFRSILHYLIVNIPGNELNKGEIKADYRGSRPPNGSGFHRYIYLLYKQDGLQDFSKFPNINASSTELRRNFNISKFTQENNLKEIMYGNFYLAKFDPAL